jgi:hypothetical protein
MSASRRKRLSCCVAAKRRDGPLTDIRSGSLRLHTEITPYDSVLMQDPCEPLVSVRINRQFSGRNLPPLMFRAFGGQMQLEACTRLAQLRGDQAGSLNKTAHGRFGNRAAPPLIVLLVWAVAKQFPRGKL